MCPDGRLCLMILLMVGIISMTNLSGGATFSHFLVISGMIIFIPGTPAPPPLLAGFGCCWRKTQLFSGSNDVLRVQSSGVM